ncbi:nucleotidyltransferase domain-containing protein [Microbacterium sp. W4I20]|uniref:nucleotidyltransferase domain-containing protein n=1 Tax=Microbacterium sp. W4I20 TaxID=3042262 RepID=UPI002785703F|nr:nucleotidyltransferase domain-containing protein [Microbacterium sp. W4I20]MDQ0725786.1 putative nucleotidyltransferase [Microbacterium sp. W4I20]
MDHLAAAERFIARSYPRASTAVVGGSTARGERTATSDIDLLLIGDALFDDASQTSEASTHRFEGETIEVFAYTPTGFAEWAERGVSQHRPVIVDMLVEGIAIREDSRTAELRRHWRMILDAGPTIDVAESAFRRYVITDVLDDLRDATDPLERHVLSSVLFERTAELMLLTNHRWVAIGKWLPRRLRALDARRADALSAPLLAGDHTAFADRVAEELDRAGGRVQEGFVR